MKLLVPTLALIVGCCFFAASLCGQEDADSWSVATQEQWEKGVESHEGIELKDGQASPTGKTATFKSVLKRFPKKRQASAITIDQSSQWLNWQPAGNLGPKNLQDAPVMLSLGPNNYWMFGRYGGFGKKKQKKQNQKKQANKNQDGKQQNAKQQNEKPSTPEKPFVAQPAKLAGFDIALKTTPDKHQFDAPGGLQPRLGGYHAWQSKDMVNWVHHGPVTEKKAKWMTTAEYADGKAYFYYDFPNDQDPHVYVDADLFDGKPGIDEGIAYDDPSHGSDCAIIRDLDGKFHLILEDWGPINAKTHAWDSPLAAHAVSSNGVDDFKAVAPPVDERTTPTGEMKTYNHPHWVKENPERFKTNVAEYEVHKPEQNAFGDWAATCIGGQYYLFCDYDPADGHGMSVGWFTSDNIDKQFKWCSNIGRGHPDPDVMFAEGKFYLGTQQPGDYMSPGPWVEDVEVRVGVDTDNDGKVDQWTDWSKVSESYDYIEGFAKQIAKTPAKLDLSKLPAGFGFQYEVKLTDTTENASKPVIEAVTLSF